MTKKKKKDKPTYRIPILQPQGWWEKEDKDKPQAPHLEWDTEYSLTLSKETQFPENKKNNKIKKADDFTTTTG